MSTILSPSQRIKAFDLYAVRAPSQSPDDNAAALADKLADLYVDDEHPTVTLHQHHTALQHHIDTLTHTYITHHRHALLQNIDRTAATEYIKQLRQRLNLQASITMYKTEMLNVLNNKAQHTELDRLLTAQHHHNTTHHHHNAALRDDDKSSGTVVAVKRYEQNVIERDYTPTQQYIWYTQQSSHNTALLHKTEQQARDATQHVVRLENELITVLHDYKNKNMAIRRQLLTFDDSAAEQLKWLDNQLILHSDNVKACMHENIEVKGQLGRLHEQIELLQRQLKQRQAEYAACQQHYNTAVQQCHSDAKSVEQLLMQQSQHVHTQLTGVLRSCINDSVVALTDTLRLDLVCKQCFEVLTQPVILNPCRHTLCRKCIMPYRTDLNSNTCVCPECKSVYDATVNAVSDDLENAHVIIDNDETALYRNPFFTASLDEPYTGTFTYTDNTAAVQLVDAYYGVMEMIETTQPMLDSVIKQSEANIHIQPLIEQLAVKFD